MRWCSLAVPLDHVSDIIDVLAIASDIWGAVYIPHRQVEVGLNECLIVERIGGLTKSRRGVSFRRTQTCMYDFARSALERTTRTREGSTRRMCFRRRGKAWLN